MRTIVFLCTSLLLLVGSGSARRYSVDDSEDYGGSKSTEAGLSSKGASTIEMARSRRPGFLAGLLDFLTYNSDQDLAEKAKRVSLKDISWLSVALVFFPFEACGLATIGLGILAFYANGRINKMMVTSFLRNHIALLSTQFHRLDVGDASSKGATILQDGSNHYTVYASGRKHLKQCLISFDLAPRQNIFYWAGQVCRLSRNEDLVTIEASMRTRVPFSLVLAQGVKLMNAKISEQPVLSRLPLQPLEKTFGSCVTDSRKIATLLMPTSFEKRLSANMQCLNSLVMSDYLLSRNALEAKKALTDESKSPTSEGNTRSSLLEGAPMVSLSFSIPSISRSKKAEPSALMALFFELVDRLHELEIPTSTRRQAEGVRQGLHDKLKRAVAASKEIEKGIGSTTVDELLA